MTPETFPEVCKKCRGKGVRFFGRKGGSPTASPCRPCGGTGEREFKAPAEKRAKVNEQAKARKALKLANNIEAFKLMYPKVWAWMEMGQMGFAFKMKDALLKWGGLTDKQLAASQRCAK